MYARAAAAVYGMYRFTGEVWRLWMQECRAGPEMPVNRPRLPNRHSARSGPAGLIPRKDGPGFAGEERLVMNGLDSTPALTARVRFDNRGCISWSGRRDPSKM